MRSESKAAPRKKPRVAPNSPESAALHAQVWARHDSTRAKPRKKSVPGQRPFMRKVRAITPFTSAASTNTTASTAYISAMSKRP